MKLFLISFLVIFALGEIVFVSELSRHGARSPGHIFNFTKDPEDNFKRPMELSTIGMRQHYLIGREFRHRYIDQAKLISGQYNSSEIRLKSTDYERTLDSALSQMSGIYPPEVCQQTLNNWQQSHALPPLHIDDAESIIKNLSYKALPDCFNLLPIVSEKKLFAYDMEIADVHCPPYSKVVDELSNSDTYKQMYVEVNQPMQQRFSQFLKRDVDLDEVWDL